MWAQRRDCDWRQSRAMPGESSCASCMWLRHSCSGVVTFPSSSSPHDTGASWKCVCLIPVCLRVEIDVLLRILNDFLCSNCCSSIRLQTIIITQPVFIWAVKDLFPNNLIRFQGKCAYLFVQCLYELIWFRMYHGGINKTTIKWQMHTSLTVYLFILGPAFKWINI